MKHINLPDSEPRCRNRSKNCGFQDKCARNRAPLPAKYAAVGDFSIGIIPVPIGGGWCSMFRAIDFEETALAQPGVKPWIGEAA